MSANFLFGSRLVFNFRLLIADVRCEKRQAVPMPADTITARLAGTKVSMREMCDNWLVYNLSWSKLRRRFRLQLIYKILQLRNWTLCNGSSAFSNECAMEVSFPLKIKRTLNCQTISNSYLKVVLHHTKRLHIWYNVHSLNFAGNIITQIWTQICFNWLNLIFNLADLDVQ